MHINLHSLLPFFKVNFVAGKKAIMTIYEGESSDVWEDGMVEKEKVVLSDYKTKVRRFCCLLIMIYKDKISLFLSCDTGGDACING